MSKDEILDVLRGDLPHLSAQYGVRRIGVFGSYATGSATEKSDVDIIIEFEKPIGLEFVRLAERLERLLGRKADVLTPAGIAGIRNKAIAESVRRSIVYA